VSAPPGFRVRPPRASEAAAVAELIQVAWRRKHVEPEDADPSLWVVADAGGQG
jgi:hypothetical protein